MESRFGWLQERAKDMILPQSERGAASECLGRPLEVRRILSQNCVYNDRVMGTEVTEYRRRGKHTR